MPQMPTHAQHAQHTPRRRDPTPAVERYRLWELVERPRHPSNRWLIHGMQPRLERSPVRSQPRLQALMAVSSLLTLAREPHPVFPHQPQKHSQPDARVGEHPSGADYAVAPRFPGRPLPYPTEPQAGVPRLQARTQSAALGQDGEHHPPSNLQPLPGALQRPVDSATGDHESVHNVPVVEYDARVVKILV